MKELILKFKSNNILMVIILMSLTIAEIATSFTLSQTINAMIAQNVNQFIRSISLTLVIYGFFLLFTYSRIVFQSKTEEEMKVYLRHDLTNRLISTDYQGYHQNKPTAYSSWLMNDINQIAKESLSPFYELLLGIISLVISTVTLLSLHWLLVVYSVVALGLILIIPKLFNQAIVAGSLRLTAGNESYLSKVSDYLHAYDTLFSYRRLPFMAENLEEEAETLSNISYKFQKLMALVAVAGGFGNIIGQIGIFAVTGYLVINGQLTVGSIMITTSLAGNIFNTAGNLSQNISQVQSSKPIFEKFDTIKHSSRSVNTENYSKPITDGYCLDNVTFSYDDKRIIDNLTTSFDIGKNYAIIGESGSGKSTLLNLIAGRAEDYQGTITLNGREISKKSYNQLFEEVLYIDQNPHIFDGTIRDNLEMGERFTDEELWNTLSKVQLREVIEHHPEGLDYDVGQGGKLLSGGQKQRLSIARSLLRNKTFLLLDEVTSNLDRETAINIEKMLLNQNNTSVIMITHNLRDEIANSIHQKLYL